MKQLFFIIAMTALLGVSPLVRGNDLPGLSNVWSLDVAVHDQTLHLLIARQPGKTSQPMQLHYLRHDPAAGTWSEPVRVDAQAPTPGRLNRGNDARLAVHGQTLIAVWTIPGNGPWNTGPLATAVSHDGGQTWQPGPLPAIEDHDANASHAYRFPAIVAAKGEQTDAFDLAWIDAHESARRLRTARTLDGGRTWQPAVTVDDRMCACCWNTTLHHNGRTYVLYRDIEPSDMRLAVREADGHWQVKPRIAPFGWRFDGCPHVGGALAITHPHDPQANHPVLHATAWTAKDQKVGAYVVRSLDGGASWTSPARLGSVGSRHTDLATHEQQGVVAAAWDEVVTDGRAIFVSLSRDQGQTWGQRLRLSADDQQASHPRVAMVGDALWVLWTQGQEHRLVAKRLPLR